MEKYLPKRESAHPNVQSCPYNEKREFTLTLCSFRIQDGEPNAFQDPVLQEISKSKGKTIAQVHVKSCFNLFSFFLELM